MPKLNLSDYREIVESERAFDAAYRAQADAQASIDLLQVKIDAANARLADAAAVVTQRYAATREVFAKHGMELRPYRVADDGEVSYLDPDPAPEHAETLANAEAEALKITQDD